MSEFEVYTKKDKFVKQMLKERGIPQGTKILVMTKKKDRPTGRITKIPEKMKIMMEHDGQSYDFLIEIARWILGREVDGKSLEDAIIMHEVWHLDYDEEQEKVKIRDHDVEEFSDVIKRYGDYHPALKQMHEAFKKEREEDE